MVYYSQRDKRWGNEQLGSCTGTLFKDAACKITCLASFCGRTPLEVNVLIPYVNGCLTNDETAAKALGIEFGGRSTVKPSHDCIAETNHYKSKGVPQHFFILLADGRCVDPLDLNPVPKKNPYKIVSYRLFKPLVKEEPMRKDFIEAIENLVGKDYGDNINEKEQEDAAKRLKEVKNNIALVMKIAEGDRIGRSEAEKEAIQLSRKLGELEAKLPEAILVAEDRLQRISTLEKEKLELSGKVGELEAKLAQYQANETPDVPTDTIDSYSLTELAGAFFRKLISVKK